MAKLPSHAWFYHVESVHEYGVDVGSRIIYIHPIEVDGEVDEEMAARFIKNLSLLEERGDGDIRIKISSCGGSWDYGMAIFDAISASDCHITTISYAWARSMSSIIPQAADHRVIMPHATVMVHYGTDGYEGPAHGLMPYAEAGEITKTRMLDIYVSRCRHGPRFVGLSEQEVREFVESKIERRSDWWMTAAEAVEFGFMDEIWTAPDRESP